MSAVNCELCEGAGGRRVWADTDWRVVRVEDADFPAFYRVVAGAHVAEFGDLAPAARARCMALVAALDRVLRAELRPAKINIASLGNLVPHLHWHVVARFSWDSHFPQPIWGQRQRAVSPAAGDRLGALLAGLDDRAAQAMERCVAGPAGRGDGSPAR